MKRERRDIDREPCLFPHHFPPDQGEGKAIGALLLGRIPSSASSGAQAQRHKSVVGTAHMTWAVGQNFFLVQIAVWEWHLLWVKLFLTL